MEKKTNWLRLSVYEVLDKRTMIVYRSDRCNADSLVIKNFTSGIVTANTMIVKRENIDNFDLWDGAPNVIYGTKD